MFQQCVFSMRLPTHFFHFQPFLGGEKWLENFEEGGICASWCLYDKPLSFSPSSYLRLNEIAISVFIRHRSFCISNHMQYHFIYHSGMISASWWWPCGFLRVTIGTTDSQTYFKHLWHKTKNTWHLVVWNTVLVKIDRHGWSRRWEILHSWKTRLLLNSSLFSAFS